MKFISTEGILYICVAAVCIFGLTNCGPRSNPDEVKAVSEACAKIGKEPSIYIGNGRIEMGCKEQPAPADVPADDVPPWERRW